MMLTIREHQVLWFIIERLKTGVAPTYDEICSHLNQKSKGAMSATLNALENKGYIRRLRWRARAIEVIKFPLEYSETTFDMLSRISELEVENLRLKSKLALYAPAALPDKSDGK